MAKKYVKKRGRRRYRRRLATVATVKRLITRQEETKRFWVGMADFKPGSRRVYACAPFRDILKGTESYHRVADRIQNITLNVAVGWTPYGLDSTASTKLSTGMPLRFMIVKARNDISGLSGNSWSQITVDASGNTQLPVFANTVQTVSSLVVPHPDYKIVKQFWLRSDSPVTSSIAGTTVFKQVSVKIPRYDYDTLVGTSFAKGFNYYLVATTSGGQDVPDNATNGSLQCHYVISFKDA